MIFKYVSIKKILNYLKLQLLFHLKKVGINTKYHPLPFSLSIEPTNYCNLNCPECPTGTNSLLRQKGFLDFSLYKKIIDEQKSNLFCLILYFQGEPLLHKDLAKIIKYASTNNIYTILSSNALLLEDNIEAICSSGLNKLIISMDGISQETYQKYRIGGQIEDVYSVLSKFNNYKGKKPFIELQYLVFRHNEHEVSELKNIKTKYGINRIRLKTAMINDSSKTNLIPINKKYSRYYIDKSNKLALLKKSSNSCFRMFSSAVITWDGNVCPCCYDKDCSFNMGNIINNSFLDIWNSKKYSDFRTKVFIDRKSIEICNSCNE